MYVDTNNKIELARREAEAELEREQAIEDEKIYQEEKLLSALDSYDQVEDYYYGRALVKRDGKYGYIDKTLSLDGDPLDILVLSSEKTFPGCVVDARIVGYLDVVDNGDADQKVIAVVNKDPRFAHIQELSDIPESTLEIIKDFFKTYKTLQKITVEIKDYHGKEDALKLLEENRELYLKNIEKGN